MQTSLEHPTFPPSVPSAITACRIGEYIVAAHTPAGDPWDQAVTILYGTYHSLVQKEKTKEGLHDLFVDRLLISVGRTNGEQSLPNPVLVRLAQQVFKPEISMHE